MKEPATSAHNNLKTTSIVSQNWTWCK